MRKQDETKICSIFILLVAQHTLYSCNGLHYWDYSYGWLVAHVWNSRALEVNTGGFSSISSLPRLHSEVLSGKQTNKQNSCVCLCVCVCMCAFVCVKTTLLNNLNKCGSFPHLTRFCLALLRKLGPKVWGSSEHSLRFSCYMCLQCHDVINLWFLNITKASACPERGILEKLICRSLNNCALGCWNTLPEAKSKRQRRARSSLLPAHQKPSWSHWWCAPCHKTADVEVSVLSVISPWLKQGRGFEFTAPNSRWWCCNYLSYIYGLIWTAQTSQVNPPLNIRNFNFFFIT